MTSLPFDPGFSPSVFSFEARRASYEEGLQGTTSDTQQCEDQLHQVGNTIIKIRLGTLRILEQLGRHGKLTDINSTLKTIGAKVKTLVDENVELKRVIGKGEAQRNYGAYVHDTPPSARLIRVPASAAESAESDEGLNHSPLSHFLNLRFPGAISENSFVHFFRR